jgi:hypothetical protein
MVLNHFRPYSILEGLKLKAFPTRVFVRQLFGNAKEREEKREKM